MASDWFQLYGTEIAINAGYNKRTGMPQDCYALIQFWEALLSIGHVHRFPQTNTILADRLPRFRRAVGTLAGTSSFTLKMVHWHRTSDPLAHG